MLPVSTSVIRRALSRNTALLLILGLFAAPGAVHAQVLYGSIVGNVTDNTGAALPGAMVTITHVQTGTSRETTTDQTGSYRFRPCSLACTAST